MWQLEKHTQKRTRCRATIQPKKQANEMIEVFASVILEYHMLQKRFREGISHRREWIYWRFRVPSSRCSRSQRYCWAQIENTQPGRMETFVYGNLETRQYFFPALEGIDAIVHLAARVHMMRERGADVEAAHQLINTEITKKIAAQAAEAGVQKFVFLSSVKVNGENTQTEPFSEKNDPAPKDAYGRSKLSAERALQRISENTKLACTSLRVPLVYGPGVKANVGALLHSGGLPIPLPLGGITNNREAFSL